MSKLSPKSHISFCAPVKPSKTWPQIKGLTLWIFMSIMDAKHGCRIPSTRSSFSQPMPPSNQARLFTQRFRFPAMSEQHAKPQSKTASVTPTVCRWLICFIAFDFMREERKREREREREGEGYVSSRRAEANPRQLSKAECESSRDIKYSAPDSRILSNMTPCPTGRRRCRTCNERGETAGVLISVKLEQLEVSCPVCRPTLFLCVFYLTFQIYIDVQLHPQRLLTKTY